MKRTCLLLVLSCFLVASGPGCNCGPPDPEWEIVQQDLDGAILSFWGESTADIFAVGGTLEVGGGDALILRYDGTAWFRMDTDAATLWWVHGFGPDDVWAVGERGTIAYFDGNMWTTVETGASYTLWGVWGASPAELWAVGGTVGTMDPSTLLRYDGNGWNPVPGVGLDGELLFKVWGTVADDVWVVGDGGAMIHWDGVDWTRIDVGVTDRIVTLYGRGPNDIYAVGGLIDAVLLHYDGTDWSPLDPGLDEGLMGVWTATDESVIITGFRGLVLTGDQNEWTLVAPPVTQECLHAAWGDGEGNLLAGGGNLLSTGSRRGVILGLGDVAGGPVSTWTGAVY